MDRNGDFLLLAITSLAVRRISVVHTLFISRDVYCVVDYYTVHGSTDNLCALDRSKAK